MDLWDKQDYETKRQYLYFQKFLESNTRSFTEFYKTYVSKLDKDFTDKTPPTYQTFQVWGTSNKWTERYEAYDAQVLADANVTIRKIAAENMIKDYIEYDKLERKVRQLSIKTAENLSTLDSKSAYTLSESSKAIKTYQESKRLISGESTENTNNNITADVNARIKSVDIMKEIDELEKVIQNENEE